LTESVTFRYADAAELHAQEPKTTVWEEELHG